MSAKTKETVELTSQEKLEIKKKKKKKRTALIVVLSIVGTLLIIITLIVLGARKAMKSLMNGSVSLAHPERGELVSEITISGVVESEKTIHYTAPESILIDTIQPAGTYVKKGEKILEFDTDSYNTALKVAELKSESGRNTYENTVSKNEDTQKKYEDARARFWKYSKLVDEQQAVVDQLNVEITDGNAYFSAALTKQIELTTQELNDYQYQNKEKLESISALGYVPTEEEQKWLKEYNDCIHEKQDLLTILNNQLKNLSSSATAYDNQKKLSEATSLLADYKAQKASAESEMKSYQGAVASELDKENLEINNQLSDIETDKYYNAIAEYSNGLIAPFDGVVTMAGYTDDDTTVMGAPLITFSSLDDLHVNVGVNKTDLENLKEGQKAVIKVLGNTYNGSVKTINRMVSTTGNSSQVMVTVSIDDPDDNMYLGIDAKCTIELASIDDCLKVPVESVNIDNIGEFVYTMDPTTMVIGKKYVETGVSSDFDIEILSGIDEKDIVVTTYTGTITEGMPAMVSPESAGLLTASDQ